MNYKEAFHAAIDGAVVRPEGEQWSLVFDNGYWVVPDDNGDIYDVSWFIEKHPEAQWEIVSFTNKFNVGDFVSDVATGQFYRIKKVNYDYHDKAVVYTVDVTASTISVKYERQLREVK